MEAVIKMIELTQQERDKFALWLEKEAEQSDMIAKQADSMKGGRDDIGNQHNVIWEQVASRERMWAATCTIVAKRLRSIESMTIER